MSHGDFAGSTVCPLLVPFFCGFTWFMIFSGLSNSFACLSLNSRALPAFMRPARSRCSLRASCQREFDWQFNMICCLISLSGFAGLLKHVWNLSRVSPSFCFACQKLYTLYVALTCGEKWAVSFRRPSCNPCPPQCLEAC